jgi:ChrR Cupin-like domain/Putative zinc-finger
MSPGSDKQGCDQIDLASLYLLHALPSDEMHAAEAHISGCSDCRQELETLRPVIDSLVHYPTDVLRPSESLWGRLARRIAQETSEQPFLPMLEQSPEPAWREVGSGISCKLFATDSEHDRVSMLVRLAPGAAYPPHRHAGVEELYLLHGELWIDDKKLYPGDYNRSDPGTGDKFVWSETGCTCVLITSDRDVIL